LLLCNITIRLLFAAVKHRKSKQRICIVLTVSQDLKAGTSHSLPALAQEAHAGFSSEHRRFAVLQLLHPRKDLILLPFCSIAAPKQTFEQQFYE
jgi:hypothetical protein